MKISKGCFLLLAPFPWHFASQSEEWFCSGREVRDVMMEVVQHPTEPLHLLHVPRSQPVPNCFTFHQIMFQTVVGDLHPKEDDLTLAFTESEAQSILPKLPQDLIHPIPMHCQVLHEHYNIVNVGLDMSSCNLLPQHMIHEVLEGRRCVLQPKPHNCWFKESARH